jgi:ketosteroid isomerase-like protein
MSGWTSAGPEAAVLDANATFYRAFTEGDFSAMSDLWARRAPLACLHPGARVLVGRAAVMAAWKQILESAPRFVLRCDRPAAHVLGDAAVVTCYEGNGEEPAHLAATNVFVLEDARWRMVHHHAGPISNPIPQPPAPRTVN